MNTIKLKKNALFNPEGDTDLRHRRMIGGNTTNLNDFNNCIHHDKQPNASCSYTVILSAVGAVYHALLYTGK